MQKETTSEDSIALAIYSSNGILGNFELLVPRDVIVDSVESRTISVPLMDSTDSDRLA
jgi:hypothetical protein